MARCGFSLKEVPETSTPLIPGSICSLYYSAISESLETRLISAVPLDPTVKTLTHDGKLVPGAYVWDIDLAMSKPPLTRVSHVSSPVSAPIPLTDSSLIAKTSSSLQSNPLVVLQSQSLLDSRERTSACRKTASLPVFAAKKYKKVADRTYPVRGTLPEEFRIVRRAHPDPLADIPVIPPVPPPFAPSKRYTQQRHDAYNTNKYGFLTRDEEKLVHHVIRAQEDALAWEETEKGRFKDEYFDPILFLTLEHVPWVIRNLPIPPGLYDKVVELI